MQKPSKPGDNPKTKWKFEAPATGASTEKVVDWKTFWWCDGSGGKHHKAMYCRHKPSDCKQQDNRPKVSSCSFDRYQHPERT